MTQEFFNDHLIDTQTMLREFPSQISAFKFAVLAVRRAEELRRGCVPRVEGGHKFVVTAQLEVIAGRVVRAVEDTAQTSPDAVELTQAQPCATNSIATLTLRAPELQPRWGWLEAEMAPSGRVIRI